MILTLNIRDAALLVITKRATKEGLLSIPTEAYWEEKSVGVHPVKGRSQDRGSIS